MTIITHICDVHQVVYVTNFYSHPVQMFEQWKEGESEQLWSFLASFQRKKEEEKKTKKKSTKVWMRSENIELDGEGKKKEKEKGK